MSYRTLVELNHDYCPTDETLLEWAKAMVAYMRSGFLAELPKGVTWKDMRHHSDPERLPPGGHAHEWRLNHDIPTRDTEPPIYAADCFCGASCDVQDGKPFNIKLAVPQRTKDA
jgi:hypothetical protein